MSEHAHKPSIVDKQLVRCSVSQVATADENRHGGCLRKWAFDKIDHIREEDSPAAKESTKGHSIAETYLTSGFEPAGNNDIERSFLAGKHMLPPPGTVEVERQFDGEISLAGVPFNGRIDVWFPRLEDDGVIRFARVRDHKFKSGPHGFLTGDQMEREPQMTGYGMVAAALLPEATHVDLGHYNYSKERPYESRPVSRLVPLEVIQKRWQSLEPVVKRMKDAAKEASAVTVPGNYKACYAYGKKYACPHVATCEKLKGTKMSTGWTAEELALFGPPAAAKSAPVPAPEKSAMPSHDGTAVTDGPGWQFVVCSVCQMPMTALGKRPPGHTITPDLCPNKASHAAAEDSAKREAARIEKAKAAGILPPDAPVSDPALAAACEKCEDEKNFQHRPEECPKKDGAPEKKKRGRKPKVTDDVKPGDVVEVPGVEQPQQVVSVTQDEIVTVPTKAAPTEFVEVRLSPFAEKVEDLLTQRLKSEAELLRDEFAAAVVAGIVAGSAWSPAQAAKLAYEVADAMLEARNGK